MRISKKNWRPLPNLLVADAGPLIALANIHRLDVPERLFQRVLVPQRVLDECLTGGRAGSADIARAAARKKWQVVPDVPHELPPSLSAALGAGEAAAIALAQTRKSAMLLMDDWIGRRVARSLGLPVIGVLGLLAAAKQRRFVLRLRPLLDQLEATGYHLSPKLIEAFLREIGEGRKK